MTESQFLSLTNERQQYALLKAIESGFAKNQETQIIAAGTVYTLTTTASALDFGTTDPVLPAILPGTYLLLASVDLETVGATITNQTLTVKIRRTNNTAADIDSYTFDIPAMTTLTQSLGRFPLGPIKYVTTNSDDSLTIFGSISGALGAGTITTSGARIEAIRLY